MNKITIDTPPKDANIEPGNIFINENEDVVTDKQLYILALVNTDNNYKYYSLINLCTGNRFDEPKKSIEEAVKGFKLFIKNATIHITY